MQDKFINHNGFYGPNQDFGGQYIPEILYQPLQELTKAFQEAIEDSDFMEELAFFQTNLTGRPSPLVLAKNLTEQTGGAKIYFKNEGNNLTGSHKINHCLFQALLAKKMGKTKIIVETGAGQHGLASAMMCAKFGLECVVYMGARDIAKQYPNVFWMKQVGATIVPVTTGDQNLTAAVDAAIGAWIESPDSYYMIGSCVGPHPYPEIMRESQKIISKEISEQLRILENQKPDVVVACVGGGSNATGAFDQFLDDESVRLIAVEAAGKGLDKIHSSKIASREGKKAIMEGFKSYFLLDDKGQAKTTGNISAGLDYVGISPFLSYLYSIDRIEVDSCTDDEVVAMFQLVAREEGLLIALESAHAVATGIKIAKTMTKDQIVVINLSGRADNYIFNIAKAIEDKDFKDFANKF